MLLPFENRFQAGSLLADELTRRGVTRQAVVVALPRGGVPIGAVIAQRLRLALDVLIVRKLGVPHRPELAMGAISGPLVILEDALVQTLRISANGVERVIEAERREMDRREQLYRAGKPPVDIDGKTVILVDDGLATGNTMLVAVRRVRESKAGSIVVAAPVGSEDACAALRQQADEVVCLATPKDFRAVGMWYREFEQISDKEVKALLAEAGG